MTAKSFPFALIENSRPNRRPAWLSLIALLILPLLLHMPALSGRRSSDPMVFVAAAGDTGHYHAGTPWIDPNVGFQAQALGKLSADQWLSGHVPWWNSYNGVGLPLAAEAQPGSFFMPFVLLTHFRSGGIWIELLMQMIAGICTLALLQRLEVTALAAFAGALLFELNGTFTWHGAPITSPVAFLPMLVLGVEILRARIVENRPGGWWLIPPALAWSICAGFPETAYIDGLFVAAWTVSRLHGLEHGQRLPFLVKLGASVCTGLLLSLPMILPFAEFTGRAYLGLHESALAHARPPYATLPLYLMPRLYGPIFSFDDPAGVVYATWSSVGGYFPAVQCLLAGLSLVFSRRRMRFFFLAWIVLCLSKSFDVQPISDVINMIPMIKSAAFARYAPPSWEFAGAMLVALTIDGLQRDIRVSPTTMLLLAAMFAAITIGTTWLGHDTIRALWSVHGYQSYFWMAVGWLFVSSLAAVVLVMNRRRSPAVLSMLVALLAVDACLAFEQPIRSGVQHVLTHEDGVAYLKKNIGWQRIYTLGPLAPNYGAFFGIAQINHNYLPVTTDWVDYVKGHLDAHADPIIFNGSFGHTDAATQLNEHLKAYEALGVKYVLAPPETDPFEDTSPPTSDPQQQNRIARPLDNGKSISISWLLPEKATGRTVRAINILIGNYQNRADGVIALQLCNERGNCSKGRRNLIGSRDNAPLRVDLDTPLALSLIKRKQRVTLKMQHLQANAAFALWQMPQDAHLSVNMDGQIASRVPSIVLSYVPMRDAAVKLVYNGEDMAIYQLPNPAPYFESGANTCELHAQGRESLQVDCRAPSQLLRREAYYPGWQAQIDGRQSAVERSRDIFQSVNLPVGHHIVTFDYQPSNAWLILVGWILGVCGWLFGAGRELARRNYVVA